jgi:hypothetical protein
MSLLRSTSAALEPTVELSVSHFLNVAATIEAVVLLDELRVMSAATSLPSTALAEELVAGAGLRNLDMRITPRDIKRLYARMPHDAASLLPFRWLLQTAELGMDLDPHAHSPFIEANLHEVSPSFTGTSLHDVNRWLSGLAHYESGEGARTYERLARGNGYAFLAVSHGLDYFPDSARAPTVAAFIDELRTSISAQLYRSAVKPIDSVLDPGGGWPETFPLPIPPLTAIVLDRAQTRSDIIDQMMILREEYSPLRSHIRSLRAALRAAHSVKERRAVLSGYRRILEDLSGSDRERVSIAESIDLSENALRAAINPSDSGAWAVLLKRPVGMLSEWWRHRPYSVLFRLDSKIPNLEQYGSLVRKHWGDSAQDRVSADLALYAYHVKELFGSSPSKRLRPPQQGA